MAKAASGHGGVDPKVVVKAFYKACAWTWTVRNQYRVLYEQGDKRLQLLDNVAQDYFSFMQDVLQEHILLQFSKLTDPARQGPHDNLTAEYVANELSWPPGVAAALRACLDRLRDFSKFIAPARNKIIAHGGLQEHVAGTVLGAFPAGEDERFLSTLQEFVDIAYQHTFGMPAPLCSVSPQDADKLVMVLKRGVAFQGLWSRDPRTADELLRQDPYHGA